MDLARLAPGQRRRMATRVVHTFTGRLHAHQMHVRIIQEGREHADGVRAATHAGSDVLGQPAVPIQELRTCLAPDDRLEVPHHLRERMRPHDRSDRIQVIGRVRQVLLESTVHGFLQRGRSPRHRHQPAPQNAHLRDVRVLFLDVHLAHVDLAGNAHQCTGGCQCHPVLTGSGFGNHLLLAHEAGQQCFAQAVVDLVRTRMVEVLALEMDLRAAQLLRQPPCMEDRARPTHVVGLQRRQLLLEVRPLPDCLVGGVDVVHRLLQYRRHQLPPIGAKIALGIGQVGIEASGGCR